VPSVLTISARCGQPPSHHCVDYPAESVVAVGKPTAAEPDPVTGFRKTTTSASSPGLGEVGDRDRSHGSRVMNYAPSELSARTVGAWQAHAVPVRRSRL
jgi:hypothetical protein